MKRIFLGFMAVALILPLSVTVVGQSKKNAKADPKKSNSDDMWLTEVKTPLPTNVTHHQFRSSSMNRDIGYCLYLPPSYSSSPKHRYPVIYHLHGATGNEARSVHSAEVLHEGILAGRWPEMIMVFPNGGRATMYQDSGDGRYMAETMMIKELIPLIDKKYRTHADRKGRCIEGFSMGGRGSTHLAMKYPELFGSLFNQSGNVYHVSDISQRPNDYLGEDENHLKANDPYLNLAKNLDFIRNNLRIRMGCGTADPDHLVTVRQFHAALTESKVEHEYFEVEGLDHNQKKMIDGMKNSWFQFHVSSLKAYNVPLFYHPTK
jgi:enterochelin esterase-like enzyme